MKKKTRHWRQRLRDFALYCAIGVAVALSAIFYGVHQARAHVAAGLPIKWIGFAILTALVFGNEIRFSPDRRRSRRFWTAMAALLALHLLIGILILVQVSRIGMLQFFLITPIELMLLARLVDMTMKPEEQHE